jgi:hypothetical protein
VQDATSHAGAASDLHVTADGQRVLIEARRRLFALDGQLSDGLPKVADSLDGIRAGIV